jgi:hypothetical protein
VNVLKDCFAHFEGETKASGHLSVKLAHPQKQLRLDQPCFKTFLWPQRLSSHFVLVDEVRARPSK